jgi:hypothetical protein
VAGQPPDDREWYHERRTANYAVGDVVTFTATCTDEAGNVAFVSRTYTVVAPVVSQVLRWSAAADRSGSRPLGGATLSGDVAVFLGTTAGVPVLSSAGIRQVTFRLFDASGRRLVCTQDRLAPYDVAGSVGGLAIRVPTTLLRNGSYRMDADVVGPTGAVTTALSAGFVIDNGPRGPFLQLLGVLLTLLLGRC